MEVDVVFLFVYQRGETHVIIHPSVRVLMNGYEFFPLYSQLIAQDNTYVPGTKCSLACEELCS